MNLCFNDSLVFSARIEFKSSSFLSTCRQWFFVRFLTKIRRCSSLFEVVVVSNDSSTSQKKWRKRNGHISVLYYCTWVQLSTYRTKSTYESNRDRTFPEPKEIFWEGNFSKRSPTIDCAFLPVSSVSLSLFPFHFLLAFPYFIWLCKFSKIHSLRESYKFTTCKRE